MASENAVVIGREIERVRDRLTDALPANIPTAKFVAVLKNALNNNRELLDCTPGSVIAACEKAASDGLILDGRQAALVIFNKRGKLANGEWGVVAKEAQYIPMVAGLRLRIYNSGLVSVLATGIVYASEIEKGLFEFQEGTDPHLIHKPDLVGELGEEVAVYSVVTMSNGHKSIEVMRWSEVMRIAKMQSKNVARQDDTRKNVRKGDLVGVWAEHTGEMARKTVLRRHSKQLPFDSDTARMFERMDGLYRNEGEEIDHTDPAADEEGQDTAPAAGRKKEGAGRAALNKARQERASRPAEATSSEPSAPERQEDVEEAEIVSNDTAPATEDDRI